MRVLLASKSPRRRELLEMLRISFEVVDLGNIEEKYPEDLAKEEVPEFLSRLKAEAYKSELKENELLITADTVVILEGEILGKPKDEDDAKEMLARLAGKTHLVVSGVTVTTLRENVTFKTVTRVKFGPLTKEQIAYYVENFRPLDKAGAYGIQEWIGGVAVEGIEGSYYNVMGLPVHRLYKELCRFLPMLPPNM